MGGSPSLPGGLPPGRWVAPDEAYRDRRDIRRARLW
jgi:hypothetical protein